jgi:Ca-activated chloride channel family protein
MGGLPIEQARASVSRALLQLRTGDSFNIIAFNSGYRRLYRAPVPASRHHLQRAREFVRQLDASGGTEMLPALQAALETPDDAAPDREPSALRQVIFITDGAVGNEQALFDAIARRLGASRLFTVGIGSAPNSWFMRKAAEFGRGSHIHVGNVSDVAEKMDALFARLSRPALVGLRIDWPAGVEAWPERIPDLYAGQPLLVAARFGARIPAGDVAIRGEIGGRPWRQRLRVSAGEDPESVPGHSGVASLWARYKIDGLLDQLVTGRDPEAVRADVLGIALEHQLLSPYTSFVAVEEVPSRPAGAEAGVAPVANSRPRGQAPQTFAFPRGASPGPVQIWLGLLCLFLALMVWVMRQEESDRAPLGVEG